MRDHQIDVVVDADIDLTKLSCRRIQITRTDVEGQYRIRSTFKVYKNERHGVVYDYLRLKQPGMVAIRGNCSAPTGYYWSRPASWPTLPCNP